MPSVIRSIQASRRQQLLADVSRSSIRSTVYKKIRLGGFQLTDLARQKYVCKNKGLRLQNLNLFFYRGMDMKTSNIGGQAVIEGIMMRNQDQYSIAVRKPDQEIEVKVEPCKSICSSLTLKKIPIVRGVVSFVDSLVIGIQCLMYSASFFEEEEEGDEKPKKTEEEKKAGEKALMAGTLFFSIVIAVAVFMMLPYFLTEQLRRLVDSDWLLSVLESLVRVLIFLAYLLVVSRMKDIQRTFMYHGAEHKCINCIEQGMELNVENVMKSSRLHKRCGTSFLFFVIIVSAILLMFVRVESHVWRIVIRLLLVPVIAGLSYEIIRLAGRSENPLVNLLSKPGMALQKLTTREPDASQAEVAIAAVEAVFDWRKFLEEEFGATDSKAEASGPHA